MKSSMKIDLNFRLFPLVLFIIAIVSCNDDVNVGQESPVIEKTINIKQTDDGKYIIVYERITENEFAEKFTPGWAFEGIYDVFPDGTIGENMIPEIDGMSFSPFSVQSDGRIKIYQMLACEPFTKSYTYGEYCYSEEMNNLSLSSIKYDSMDCLETGCLISLSDFEMKIVTSLWMPQWSENNAIFSLFVFKKITEETIDNMDSEYIIED